MRERDNINGFGSAAKRFKSIGIHPELITVNTTNPLGPGHYNPQNPDCSYKSKAAGWKVKLESEEFSKVLGFHNPQLLCSRVFERSLGGPGTYEFADYGEKKGASCFQNVGFGRAKRFKPNIKDETMPPGAHTIKEVTTKFTKTPTFEWDGFLSRFKNTEPSYRRPPNLYSLPYSSITDKKVSKRGPYDTFTGPRDNTTIKNHFAPPAFKTPDIIYDIPTDIDDLLSHPSKRRCGRFLLEERFPEGKSIVATKKGFSMYQMDEQFPGPANYTIVEGITAVKKSLHPFGSSNVNARPPTNWKIHPGPDRYSLKYPTCQKKKQKGSWMFMSKEERNLARVESYSNFVY